MLSTVAPPSSFRILLCASLFHPPPPSSFFDSEKFPHQIGEDPRSGGGLWKALPGEHQASVRSIAAGQFPGLRLWSLSLAGLGLENHTTTTTTYPGPPPLRRPIGWVRLLCRELERHSFFLVLVWFDLSILLPCVRTTDLPVMVRHGPSSNWKVSRTLRTVRPLPRFLAGGGRSHDRGRRALLSPFSTSRAQRGRHHLHLSGRGQPLAGHHHQLLVLEQGHLLASSSRTPRTPWTRSGCCR